MRGRFLALAVAALVLLQPAAANAAVKYSDYRWSTPSVFVRSGDQWYQAASGGNSNTGTYFVCYPAHGWSYVSRYGDEVGTWRLPGGSPFAYGEWQVYITTSGTNTYATYSDGYSNPALNQYATHGWASLLTHGYCGGSCSLRDAEGSSYVSSHRTDWDAVRFYY
ncbi:MAG TPA: hypothetical protein VF902_00945 [Coriobacteriia bacterium]